MKYIYSIVFYVCLSASALQSQDLAPYLQENTDNRIFHNESQTDILTSDNSIVTILHHDGYHSRHSAPQSLYRYARCYFLIQASEMIASGYPAGVSIISLGYNYKYGTNLSTKGYFKVYLQNTDDLTNNKSMNWNSAIQEMTLVHSDTLMIQTAPGYFDIPLNHFENFIYTGGGIYVAFEYSNPSGPLAAVSNVAWCNKILPNPILKSSQSDDSLRVVATGTSALRPEIRFGTVMQDICEAGPVYSMGAMSIVPSPDFNFIKAVIRHCRNEPDTIFVRTIVKRVSDGFIKNEFLDTIITDSAKTFLIEHSYLADDLSQTDSILVAATSNGEEITGNNRSLYISQTTSSSRNHYISSAMPNGGVGFSVGTGEYVARFHTTGCIAICAIDVSFFAENGYGSNPYKLVVCAADGAGGLPGTLLHTSPLRYTPVAQTGVVKRSTYFPSEPISICEEYFYVGFSQTAERNLRVSYQIEEPIRKGEFFYKQPAGGGTWIEFAEISPYRFDVSPRTYLSLNMKLFLQGSFNGDLMKPDTVKTFLRNQFPPYSLVDSATAVLDSVGNALFNFINANTDSCYYFEVKHRNHIRTFSHSTCEKLNGAPSQYDFTDSSSKAFGDNMIFVPGQLTSGGFVFYAGDVNQDGTVDATDVSAIDNDAANYLSGYVVTDLTGDDFVDATDFSIADNNASNFVSVIRP
ncbi:MAG: hypothetical protein IPL67_09785 [Ignavibacteria bacterium]|nr:hypothetical protein [Ignavibacteria bacterium]